VKTALAVFPEHQAHLWAKGQFQPLQGPGEAGPSPRFPLAAKASQPGSKAALGPGLESQGIPKALPLGIGLGETGAKGLPIGPPSLLGNSWPFPWGEPWAQGGARLWNFPRPVPNPGTGKLGNAQASVFQGGELLQGPPAGPGSGLLTLLFSFWPAQAPDSPEKAKA